MALLSDVMRKASVVTLRPRGSRVAGAEFSPIVNVIPKVKKAGRPPKAKPVLFPAMPMLANAKKANVDQLFREKAVELRLKYTFSRRSFLPKSHQIR